MTAKQSLKIVFTTAISAFNVSEAVQQANGQELSKKHKKMKALHKKALKVLNTSENWETEIKKLLLEMETLASEPENNFKRGGVSIKGSDDPFISGGESVIK